MEPVTTPSAEPKLERLLSAYLRQDSRALADSAIDCAPVILEVLSSAIDSARYAQFLIALARGLPARQSRACGAVNAALRELCEPQLCNAAIASLNSMLRSHRNAWEASMLLASLYEQSGLPFEALSYWNSALYAAQSRGECIDEATTPPCLLPWVGHAVEKIRGRKAYFLHETINRLESAHQSASGSLDRIRDATDFYLKKKPPQFNSQHQRPRFFFVPDLPPEPWLPSDLFEWRPVLERGFESIREESQRVLRTDDGLEDFVTAGEGGAVHLAGQALKPTWEAFFFYRHGVKFHANHARCPRTSELLESLDLCRIDAHAPEICFSVLRAGTHILPHFGVTNARSVVHLPLIVPPGCALGIAGAGQRSWVPGQMLAFDDTYEHEAWNHSDQDRVILLMDCWNPHLTHVERMAVTEIITLIARWHVGR